MQITKLNDEDIRSRAFRMASNRLDQNKVPKESPAFANIVDRFEEGLTRQEAIKYWTSQNGLNRMAPLQEDEEETVKPGRKLQALVRKLLYNNSVLVLFFSRRMIFGFMM